MQNHQIKIIEQKKKQPGHLRPFTIYFNKIDDI